MSWLDELLEITKEAETPRSFIFWAGLCAIGAVVRKNIWINKEGVYKLYPNLYILTVAPSGYRKSLPPNLLRRLLSEVPEVRMISGRNSIEAIIQDLSRAHIVPGKKPKVDADTILISNEFSNLIIDNPASLTILTDWYDTDFVREWTNSLKTTGKEKLKNVCVSIFGATNPKHLNDRIAAKDIEGGFLGRTMVILEKVKGKVNPLSNFDAEEEEIDISSLSNRLKEISELTGKFRWSDETARKYFDDWYIPFYTKNPKDRTGAVQRIHDNILKVAMCLSLAEKDELFITKENIEMAMEHCLRYVTSGDEVTAGKGGKAQLGEQSALIIEELLKRKDYSMSRKALLNRWYRDFDAEDLDRIVKTLIQGGYIEEEMREGKMWYKLSAGIKEKYNRILGDLEEEGEE